MFEKKKRRKGEDDMLNKRAREFIRMLFITIKREDPPQTGLNNMVLVFTSGKFISFKPGLFSVQALLSDSQSSSLCCFCIHGTKRATMAPHSHPASSTRA